MGVESDYKQLPAGNAIICAHASRCPTFRNCNCSGMLDQLTKIEVPISDFKLSLGQKMVYENIYWFRQKDQIIMIDVPPLYSLGYVFQRFSLPLRHIFLTSPHNYVCLPQILRVFPDVQIYCTNECRNALRRYQVNVSNCVIQTCAPIMVSEMTFYSIPTPLAPFPSSQMIYEGSTQTLFTGFHFAHAGSTVNLNIVAKAVKFQQEFLQNISGYQKELIQVFMSGKHAFRLEHICPLFGRDWFKYDFRKLERLINQIDPLQILIIYQTIDYQHVLGVLQHFKEKKVTLLDISLQHCSRVCNYSQTTEYIIIFVNTETDQISYRMLGFISFLKSLQIKFKIGLITYGIYEASSEIIDLLEDNFEIIDKINVLKQKERIPAFVKQFSNEEISRPTTSRDFLSQGIEQFIKHYQGSTSQTEAIILE